MPNQTYQTKPAQTKPNLPNLPTKHTKAKLPNQTYQIEPTKLTLANQTNQRDKITSPKLDS